MCFQIGLSKGSFDGMLIWHEDLVKKILAIFLFVNSEFRKQK